MGRRRLRFPGDFVDVILTVKRTVSGEGSESSETRQFSETLLTDVRVLAIDQTLDNNSAAKVGKTATLEVSPKQAERVALGLDMGTLSLSLRSLGRQDAELTAARQSGAASTPTPATSIAATRATPTCCS